MSAQILDGKVLASAIKAELAIRVVALKAQGITPGLGTVLVGNDPGSLSYVGGKHRDCTEVGINSIRVDLPESATEKDVLAAELALYASKAIQKLRQENIKVELYPDNVKVGKQFQYADKRLIPFAVIAGDQEIESNSYALKNLVTGDQVSVDFEGLKNALLS